MSYEEVLGELQARISAGEAPALTLIYEPVAGDAGPVSLALADPDAGAGPLRALLAAGDLPPSLTWVPGTPEALATFYPLFEQFRALGYEQAFELGPDTGLIDWADLMVPLVHLGAQFDESNMSALLPAGEPEDGDDSDGDDAAPASAGAEQGFGGLIAILGGTLALALTLGGVFFYMAQVQQQSKQQASEQQRREAQRAYDNAVAARRLRQPAKAEQLLRRCLELEPNRIEAVAELGALLSDMHRDEEALALYDKVLARSDGRNRRVIALNYNRGNALLRLERYEEAIEAYTKAQDVVTVEARLNKVLALIRLGRLDEARRELEPFTHKHVKKKLKPKLRAQVQRLEQRLGKK